MVPPPDPSNIVNALSVDVEDYFQVQALAEAYDRKDWETCESRVEQNTHAMLEIFAEAGVKGTFFTLGWIAERHPKIVRAIVEGGHEIASHGYCHFRVDSQSSEEFRADISRTKKILEDIGGVAVRGYRAATFSVGDSTPWAWPVLEEEGYRYSSSIYPVKRDNYANPDAPRAVYSPAGTHATDRNPDRHRPDRRQELSRRAAAAISGCCPIGRRAPRFPASTGATRPRQCSICIPGKSIPVSRAPRASPPSRGFVIISTSARPASASAGSPAISAGAAWIRSFWMNRPSGRRPRPAMLLPDTDAASAEWDGFVASRPESSFFQLSGWRKVVRRAFGHACPYLIAREGGAIKAVMPLTEINSRLFGHFLIGNGFCVGGGPLFANQTALASVLEEAGELGRAHKVAYVEIRDFESARGALAVAKAISMPVSKDRSRPMRPTI